MDMVNSIEQPRARSQASHQVINTLKPAAKRFEIDYCCQLYSCWFGSQGLRGETLPSRDKNTFAAISTVMKKTSTIVTPRRYPLEGFLDSVTWVFMDVDSITVNKCD